MHSCIGSSKAPLAWIICSEVAVPAISPRALNLPHSAKNNSIDGDLIARLSHTTPSTVTTTKRSTKSLRRRHATRSMLRRLRLSRGGRMDEVLIQPSSLSLLVTTSGNQNIKQKSRSSIPGNGRASRTTRWKHLCRFIGTVTFL